MRPLLGPARVTVRSTRLTTFAALVLMALAPKAKAAVQGAELYRTQASFYGRFEARVQYAPGEGVVSSFFLWKDGSSSTTSWNELDYEKINSTCRMQTNIWTGKGTQSAQVTTPTVDLCGGYHTYAFEWTPDSIRWLIDGTELRKVTGASVSEYTQNASAGMAIHFNLWEGDSSFSGVLNSSTLPVRQYINWAQYSSYSNGAFQLQWREDFSGSSIPSGWAVGNWVAPLNHSTHNPANVSFVNGIAVLSMTAENATGYSGTPPADPAGNGGSSGSGGAGTGGAGTGGGSGSGGSSSSGGTTGSGGQSGTGGTSAGSGGTSATGGATGTGGAATGSGGSGTGGTSVSTGGASTGGSSAGTGGTGTGGSSAGTGGTGTGGSLASGGSPGSGGQSAGSGGATASGGTSGTGGAGASASGSDGGCACRAAGDGLTGGGGLLLGALLIAARAGKRRRRHREDGVRMA